MPDQPSTQETGHLGPERRRIPEEVAVRDAEERKQIVKEALQEWLDKKFETFGKWSARALAAAILVALTYFLLWANGWHR